MENYPLYLWKVFDYDTENEDREITICYFRDATNAADYCVDHQHAGVMLMLAKSEWIHKLDIRDWG